MLILDKMKIKAFKRRFRDDVVLIDESRKIENPDIGYKVTGVEIV